MDETLRQKLLTVLKKRCERIQQCDAQPRAELVRFVCRTTQEIHKTIQPMMDEKRQRNWEEAKGMLKELRCGMVQRELVDFRYFHSAGLSKQGVKLVFEPQIAEILGNYQKFIQTGQVHTRHVQPKHLGETWG
eukprot:Skav219045  [mRNA]  locus=scaffold2272:63727:64415:+ [translate_table: standard]